MTETDRANLVRDLDSRHDALLNDLEALNQQVERTLAAIRPPSTELAAPVAKARLMRR